MFKVVLGRTTGRGGIELLCGTINLFPADLRRVVRHHRVLASELKSCCPLVWAKPRSMSNLAEEVRLLLGCHFAKRFSVQCLGAGQARSVCVERH